jgi:hypothetical protein
VNSSADVRIHGALGCAAEVAPPKEATLDNGGDSGYRGKQGNTAGGGSPATISCPMFNMNGRWGGRHSHPLSADRD